MGQVKRRRAGARDLQARGLVVAAKNPSIQILRFISQLRAKISIDMAQGGRMYLLQKRRTWKVAFRYREQSVMCLTEA